MACYESGTVISLADREAITLPDVRGATLRVTQGILWLTEENERRDVVLRAGDNFVVESSGNTVVEAQNDAMFCVVGRRALALRPAASARSQNAKRGALGALAAYFTAPPRQLPYV